MAFLHRARMAGLALLCLLTAATSARAANATLSLHVTSIFGVPLPSIAVQVVDTRTTLVVSAPGLITNSSGDAVLSLPTGRYDLHLTPPAGAAVFAADKNGVRLDQSTTVPVQLPPGSRLHARTIDLQGAGVAHVDLRFADAAGNGPLHLTGAITDEAGFADVLVTPGVWTVWAEPRLDRRIAPALLGSLDLQTDRQAGAFVLEPGHAWSAHVVDAAGHPIAGVRFRVRHSASQVERFAGFGATDSLGAATLVIPTGTFDVSALPVPGTLQVARTARGQGITQDTSGPTFVLADGMHVTAQCTAASGGVLAGVECRLDSLPSRVSQELVGASSDAAGVLDVVAPASRYAISWWPAAATRRVPQGIESLELAAPLDLGTRAFVSGRQVVLQVRDAITSAPLPDVQVQLYRTPDGAWLPTPVTHTDASGVITMIAERGAYQCLLHPANAGWGDRIAFLSASVGDTTIVIALAPPGAAVGGGVARAHGWRVTPQPSRGAVRISDDSRESRLLRCEVFDALGRRVRQWQTRTGAEGVEWDGRDAAGARVSEGFYLVRIGEDDSRTARVVIVR